MLALLELFLDILNFRFKILDFEWNDELIFQCRVCFFVNG